MPIYEYRCECCSNCFETLVWSSEEGRSVCCPSCKSPDVERILSVFSKNCGPGGSGGKMKSSCAPKTSGFG